MADPFTRALHALRSTDVRDGDVSELVRDALPVGGASVAACGPLLSAETVSASDGTAFRLDEIQFDLTEGPCWTALQTVAPVLEQDLLEQPNPVWPSFNDAIRAEPIRAVFAFPIMFGPFPLGAIDLYALHPATLSPTEVEHASVLASAVSRRVLRRALRTSDQDDALLDRGPLSRRIVHQATGVVLAQLNITPDDAYLLIQGHAFARHTSMRAIAEDILAGTARFEQHGNLIENTHDHG